MNESSDSVDVYKTSLKMSGLSIVKYQLLSIKYAITDDMNRQIIQKHSGHFIMIFWQLVKRMTSKNKTFKNESLYIH